MRSPNRSLLPVLAGFALLTGCNCGTGPTPDAGADGGPFQPSNISLTDLTPLEAGAKAEDVTGSCSVSTAVAGHTQNCFTGTLKVVNQPDGSPVNLLVASSLRVEAGAVMRVTGTVPLVIISLGDIDLDGQIDAHSESLQVGAGGGAPAASNTAGTGPAGGAAGSGGSRVGGGGGSYCGAGGLGGGATLPESGAGSADLRPLKGGSSGGGGDQGSGAGGGAIELVAEGTLTIPAGGSITVGGEGGPFGGLATDQNAGGGGSGGAILLEATTVSLAGTLAANGAGGGGDYATNGGADATANATAAAGGAAGTKGGAGGNGSAGATKTGGNGTAPGSKNAGGGGGGAGWIRVNAASGTASLGGTVSPDSSTSCAGTGPLRTASEGP